MYVQSKTEISESSYTFCSDCYNGKIYYATNENKYNQVECFLNIYDIEADETSNIKVEKSIQDNIVDVCVTSNEMLCFLVIHSETYTDVTSTDYIYQLWFADLTGKCKEVINLEKGEKESFRYINKMKSDNANNIILVAEDHYLIVYHYKTGEITTTYLENEVTGIGKGTEGKIVLCFLNESGNIIQKVDTSTGILQEKEKIQIHPNGKCAIMGSENGMLLIKTESGLIRYNTKNNDKEEIINWLLSGIDESTIQLIESLQENYIVVTSEMTEDFYQKVTVHYFKKTRQEDIISEEVEYKEKTVLTFADIIGGDEIKDIVRRYNESSSEYSVVIKSYYDEDISIEDRTSRLNADLMNSGQIDMLDPRGINYVSYIRKGIFEDLYSFMNEDSDFHEDDFFMNIVESNEYYDGLYAFPYQFSLEVLFGNTDVLDEDGNLTIHGISQYMDAHAATKYIYNRATSAGMLTYFFSGTYEDYVDYENSIAHFDTDEFRELLNFCKQYYYKGNRKDMIDSLSTGETLFAKYPMVSVSLYQLMKSIHEDHLLITGVPSAENSKPVLSTLSIAMCANSENKEGVWDFISFCISEKQQSNLIFTDACGIRVSSFNEMMESYSTPVYVEENGEQIELPIAEALFGGQPFEVYALTAEDTHVIREYMSNLNYSMPLDTDILRIVQEEADAYFCGDSAIEDVTEIIQNRVQLLLYECQ